jgi:Bax protein
VVFYYFSEEENMQGSTEEENTQSLGGLGFLVRTVLGLALICMVGALSVRYAPANVPSMSTDLSSSELRTTGLVHFKVSDTAELAKVLDKAWVHWGAEGSVPGVAPINMPAGLDKLSVKEKKSLFLRSVIPHVLHVNRTIRSERKLLSNILVRLERGERLKEIEEVFVSRVAHTYKLDERSQKLIASDPVALLRELLGRVDEIPPSLVLGQAAIESAWGSSRFVLEGNNLFGQWVFSANGGMAPKGRAEGAKYSVARYRNLTESVRAYMMNLNTLWAYDDFRKFRVSMRAEGRDLDANELAQGLIRYSIRRQEYVDEIRAIIRINRLKNFDFKSLSDVDRELVDSVLIGVMGNAAQLSRVDSGA